MDAFEFMIKDHRKVDDLFKKIVETTGKDLDEREELFSELKNELSAHAFMEEKAFYPFFQKKSETHDITLESFEEHHIVKLLLRELDKMKKDTDKWMAKLTVLKESVEHHVDEEENEFFPKAKQLITSDEAKDLGEKMQAAKKEYSHEE